MPFKQSMMIKMCFFGCLQVMANPCVARAFTPILKNVGRAPLEYDSVEYCESMLNIGACVVGVYQALHPPPQLVYKDCRLS